MKNSAILILLLTLAGCATPQAMTPQQQRAADVNAAFKAAFATAMRETQDDKICQSYGFAPASDTYKGCRTALAHISLQPSN